MSINKKELIAQISQNVKAPGGETLAVGVGRSDVLPANEEQKVQVQQRRVRSAVPKVNRSWLVSMGAVDGKQPSGWMTKIEVFCAKWVCRCMHRESNRVTT